MLVLGIDTSTSNCGISLATETKIIGELNFSLKRQHSEKLLPLIRQMFVELAYKPEDLTGIAVTTGPGSFTGLRIGLTAAKVAALALAIPLVGISTLKVLAANVNQKADYILPMLDARNERVYTALYKSNNIIVPESIWDSQAISCQALANKLVEFDENVTYIIVGNGVNIAADYLEKKNIKFLKSGPAFLDPKSSCLAMLGIHYLQKGEIDDIHQLKPDYLKQPQAEINWLKKYEGK